jgi:phage shock protein E
MVIPMRNYRRLSQAIVIALVVLAIWLINPVMAAGDPEAAKQAWPMIENGALVIDVRSAQEFAGGHLDGAIRIDWDDTDALIKAIGSDKQRPVVLYCRSGNRAGKSLTRLKLGGYTNIFNATGLGALKETKP